MNKTEKIDILMKKYKFNSGTAIAYVESEGKCVYCGKNLLETLSDYYAADIDHLLPQSKYPELISVDENWVLSCRACNSIKSKMVLDNLEWSPKEAVTEHKQELVDRIKQRLIDKREVKESNFQSIKEIIQGK